MIEPNEVNPMNDLPAQHSTPLVDNPTLEVPYSSEETLSWWKIWELALFHPSEASFIKIAAQQKKNKFWLIALPGGITAVFITLVFLFFMSFVVTMALAAAPEPAESSEIIIGISIILAVMFPIIIGIFVFQFYFSAGYFYLLSKLFKGNASWDKINILLIAIFQPLMVISFFISFVPLLNMLAIAIPIYMLVLFTIAIKAINGFSWAKAVIIGVVIPVVCFCIFYTCMIFVIFIPSFQQALSSIQQSGMMQSY